MKYPIGIQTFSQIRKDGYVYVDKTDLIHQLASRGKNLFSQPPETIWKITLKPYRQTTEKMYISYYFLQILHLLIKH